MNSFICLFLETHNRLTDFIWQRDYYYNFTENKGDLMAQWDIRQNYDIKSVNETEKLH